MYVIRGTTSFPLPKGLLPDVVVAVVVVVVAFFTLKDRLRTVRSDARDFRGHKLTNARLSSPPPFVVHENGDIAWYCGAGNLARASGNGSK